MTLACENINKIKTKIKQFKKEKNTHVQFNLII